MLCIRWGRLLATVCACLAPALARADAPPVQAQALRAASSFFDVPSLDGLRSVPTSGDASGSGALSPEPEPLPQADFVLVRKSERRLYLMRRGAVLRSYRVALGLNPVGHKQRSGDFRTPEGRYRLERRNPRSDFFLSIQISYPNARDAAEARRNGWSPGGSIMIHGLPNEPRRSAEYYSTQDWTDGCIAVSNADMLEIWMLVSDNTPIAIEP
jgi:hypothetical protein